MFPIIIIWFQGAVIGIIRVNKRSFAAREETIVSLPEESWELFCPETSVIRLYLCKLTSNNMMHGTTDMQAVSQKITKPLSNGLGQDPVIS